MEENGGFSFFLIRIEDPKRTQDKFRAFVISRKRLVSLMENSGKSSCNAAELQENAEFVAKRIRLSSDKYTWNFPEFFEEFVRKGG